MQKSDYCDVCRKARLDTDCPECENRCPNLFNENKKIWKLWNNIQTQWNVIDGGIIGLNYIAVQYVAKLLGINLIPAEFSKLRLLENMTIKNSQKSK